MIYKQYDEIHEEELQPDGREGAIKRARKKLMNELRWPLCKPCQKPYELNGVMVPSTIGYKLHVYLVCEKCASGHFEQRRTSEIMI